MDHSVIYSFLREVTGIDVGSIGEYAVNRVIDERIKYGEYKNVDEYLLVLKNSASERQEFINDITVPETWFFRDREPFKLLSDYASKVWLPDTRKSLKILSIPCSTGEEPYSIAMALMDVGFSKESFTVDAVDISTKVLDVAKRGVYGKNSFRGGDLSFRDKYFVENSGLYAISDVVKEQVKFHNFNVLSSDFMRGVGPFNVIFCRNMLIYFDVEIKNSVIKALHRRIHPDGVLFLGHAETGRMVQGLFESMKHPGAFAYHPVSSSGYVVQKIAADKSYINIVSNTDKFYPRQSRDSVDIVHEVDIKDKVVANDEDKIIISLEDIQVIADRGDLLTATNLCEKYIKNNPLDADGYCLHGTIFLAQENDDKAQASFKRAVYLKPKHYQSLAHLSVLAEEQGNVSAALNYRARMERLKEEL